jgi:hypothetical protein
VVSYIQQYIKERPASNRNTWPKHTDWKLTNKGRTITPNDTHNRIVRTAAGYHGSGRHIIDFTPSNPSHTCLYLVPASFISWNE